MHNVIKVVRHFHACLRARCELGLNFSTCPVRPSRISVYALHLPHNPRFVCSSGVSGSARCWFMVSGSRCFSGPSELRAPDPAVPGASDGAPLHRRLCRLRSHENTFCCFMYVCVLLRQLREPSANEKWVLGCAGNNSIVWICDLSRF